jgi:peptidoglycan/xylan/chitin deacetylase (PgdA/CDA1 family)
MSLQIIALHLLRFLGGFAIAQRLTRKRLRILCYHGFALGDEHEVLPHVFMRPQKFERRLQILRKRRLPVIPLAEAIKRLNAGTIENAETVITFDDGWASNLSVAMPALARFGFPASIYVTTEHLSARNEVFNVALFYMLCRSPRPTLSLADIDSRLRGSFEIAGDRARIASAVIAETERVFPELLNRQNLLAPIAEQLGMDLKEVLAEGRFDLLDRAQLAELWRQGLDIELHTHTHRLPDTTFDDMAREVLQNQDALRAILGSQQQHLCYPSGRYSVQHLEWLAQLGIASATTCDPGLNPSGTRVLALRRYLDSEHVSDIVFEAEICGIRDLARDFRSMVSAR